MEITKHQSSKDALAEAKKRDDIQRMKMCPLIKSYCSQECVCYKPPGYKQISGIYFIAQGGRCTNRMFFGSKYENF